MLSTPNHRMSHGTALRLAHALGATAVSSPRPVAPIGAPCTATTRRAPSTTRPRHDGPFAGTCGSAEHAAGWRDDAGDSRDRAISGINAQAFGLMNTVKVYDARPEEAPS